ncbi:UNVERIFIED_CONTAM: hypothetical protein Sradi_3182000 [Sesamum radiatum]|uniref:Uncharacterized protein n=1 Tax=Sesamum radiatum TaxID=300843 RepID=A0AAW2REL0_SESRA
MTSFMAFSDQSIYFIKEVPLDRNPSEATSKRTGLDSSIFHNGWRQATTVAHRLIDQENVRDEGAEVDERDETDEEGEIGEGSEVGGGDEGKGSSPREDESGGGARSSVDWGFSNLRTSIID